MIGLLYYLSGTLVLAGVSVLREESGVSECSVNSGLKQQLVDGWPALFYAGAQGTGCGIRNKRARGDSY